MFGGSTSASSTQVTGPDPRAKKATYTNTSSTISQPDNNTDTDRTQKGREEGGPTRRGGSRAQEGDGNIKSGKVTQTVTGRRKEEKHKAGGSRKRVFGWETTC